MIGRAIAIWLCILVCAILNGALRQGVLLARYGEQTGRALSTLLLCAAILVVTWLAIPWIGPREPRHALGVSALWLTMTLAFEFGFGRMRGMSWKALFEDYNLAAGRIWILVLIVTAIAPWAMARVRGLFAS
jgi:hypothetical protein